MKDSEKEDASLAKCLQKMYSNQGYKHPLGEAGHSLGIAILLSFIIIIIPMFIVTWFLSPIYFWFYRQKPISPKAFFHFDRHKITNISFWDKVACEYCELANGTLQWMLAIINEIERRWCPVKNQCDPNCSKVKAWREDYLKFEHSQEERLNYYEKEYLKTFEQIPSSSDDN
jgi:hypothetical protein